MIANIGAWQTIGSWAVIVVSICCLLALWVVNKPRARAILVLTGFVCCFLPFINPVPLSVPEPAQAEQTVTQMELPKQVVNSVGEVKPTEAKPAQDVKAITSVMAFSLWDALVIAWTIGSCIGLVWLLNEIRKMNRLARKGSALSPMVAGFPFTRILLPTDWPGSLTADEARAAIAHEEAHVKGFHIQGRVLVEVFRCLFWWLPTAHVCARLYVQALEEIADAEAIRTVAPQSLASALLKVAEHGTQPFLCAGATAQGKHLETRLRKIMKNQKPGRWPTVALLFISAFGIAFAAAPKLPYLQELASVKPIFGLSKGANWTYDRNFGYGKYAGKTQIQYKVNKVIPTKSMTVYELASGPHSFYYQGVASDGLVELGRTRMSEPGFDPNDPDFLLKKPYTVGATWKWHSVFRGQIMEDPSGKVKFRDYDSDCTAVIEAEENVTVKAGTFRCYKVHVKSTSKASEPGDYTVWVSLEAGMVQRRNYDRKGNRIDQWELTKFVPSASL